MSESIGMGDDASDRDASAPRLDQDLAAIRDLIETSTGRPVGFGPLNQAGALALWPWRLRVDAAHRARGDGAPSTAAFCIDLLLLDDHRIPDSLAVAMAAIMATPVLTVGNRQVRVLIDDTLDVRDLCAILASGGAVLRGALVLQAITVPDEVST